MLSCSRCEYSSNIWKIILQGKIYYHNLDKGELIAIDPETLNVLQVTRVETDGVMFSDGEMLGVVTSTNDVSWLQ